MAYDEALAERVRRLLVDEPGGAELKMFGGLCFTLAGNMAVGVVKDELMVRVAAEEFDTALAEPGARLMDFTGRPMKGFLFVGKAGWSRPAALRRWVARGVALARSLPAKAPRPRRAPGPRAASATRRR